MSGKANVPKIKGQDVFKGEQQHSSQHHGPDAYAGKKVVVIGANNSAHDICAALWEHGADVTMVQRSSTHIVRSDSLMDIGLGDLYSERAVASGVTTRKADLIFASLPYRIMADFQVPVYDRIRERDADFYRRSPPAGGSSPRRARGCGRTPASWPTSRCRCTTASASAPRTSPASWRRPASCWTSVT